MKRFYFLAILICFAWSLKAQQKQTLTEKIDGFEKEFPKEKLYLTLDKPYYNLGDTLWFKSFLLNSDFTSSSRTDKIYIELYNDSAKFINRIAIALNNGLGYGDMLINKNLKEGTYTIRAYSNWQQNFGSDYFFAKNFYVGNANAKTWLVDATQHLGTNARKQMLDLKIKLTNIKDEPQGLKDLEVYLMNDNKRIMRTDLQTSLDGKFEVNLPITSEKITGSYDLFIIDKKDKTRKVSLPISLQNIAQIDLQFLPEGGYMVNDIFGKVAFKVIDADGMGKIFQGKIINENLEVLAEIKSNDKGMGSFYLLPKFGEKYFVSYNLNGKEFKQPLPIAKTEGTALRVDHLSKPDSMLIYVKATGDNKKVDGYNLIAQANGHTVFSIPINLKHGFINLKLPKVDFPDGIVHLTLFSIDQIPLNERQIFVNHHHKINLQLDLNKNLYQPKDSVALEINATKEDGTPLIGSFSIAVTDDGQIKQKQNETNIISYFMLESDIKGNIEDPGYYFKNADASILLALDHLLLTQAWIGYNWDEILNKRLALNFKPEKDNQINGRLTNLFKKPVPDINLTLLSLGKNLFVADTTSNADGRFSFKNLPILDTAAYLIKIKKTNGKTSSAIFDVDSYNPADGINLLTPIKPWYINTDSIVLNNYKIAEKRINQQETALKKLTGNILKEVVITTPKTDLITNETWDARLAKKLNEEDLVKLQRKTIYELLKEKLEGFTRSYYWQSCFGPTVRHAQEDFVVGTQQVSWIRIDKIVTPFDVTKDLFNYLTAEDLKELEIYQGCVTYYLDITTRGNKGPYITKPIGNFVYRPVPLYIGKEFYSPKYNVVQTNSQPDYRSTIFWDANVVTDENGKAKISFYAADKPTTYTIKIEGTDLFGRFGFYKGSIKVENKSSSK